MNNVAVEIKWNKSSSMIGDNETLRGDGWYISYNPTLAADIASIFASDNGKDETALYDGEKFFILNGDFRKEYEEAFPNGLEACKAVFEKNKDEFRSSWSEDV